jgi:hypothetical protein
VALRARRNFKGAAVSSEQLATAARLLEERS